MIRTILLTVIRPNKNNIGCGPTENIISIMIIKISGKKVDTRCTQKEIMLKAKVINHMKHHQWKLISETIYKIIFNCHTNAKNH